jgi:hypothetical protein
MRKLPILFLLIVPICTFAQYKFDAGLALGAANYLGEMGGKAGNRRDFISDIKLSKTNIAASIFGRYKIHKDISIKGSFNYMKISGDDKLSTNPGRNGRNLNFTNNIFEFAVEGQYFFYQINDLGRTFTFRNDFRAYAFIGIAAFHHNPTTTYNGKRVELQPLNTEALANPYSLWGFSTPMGMGLYFTFNKAYRLGWELGWRKTFTDYLDDVSTLYADTTLLSSPLSIELANRSDEIDLGDFAANFDPGNKRGDASHKDNYMSTTVSFSYVFQGNSAYFKNRFGGFFKKRKFKKTIEDKPKF